MNQFDPKRLAEVVKSSGLSFGQTTVSWIFTCPKCSKDILYMYKESGYWSCFKCKETDNYRGRAEYAFADLLSISVKEARVLVYGVDDDGQAAIPDDDFFAKFVEDTEPKVVEPIPTIIYPEIEYWPIDHEYGKKGADYLEGRGIPLEIAKQYNIHYQSIERRVVFPVEVNGRLVGYQKRLIIPNRIWNEELSQYREIPKVLSSKGLPRDKTLMFGDRLRNSTHAVLCEGPVDALKVHLCGGNVATMGKAVSKGQLDLLRKAKISKLYLGLDPDAATEMNRILDEFKDIEVYSLRPPKGVKDLGDLPMDEVYKLFLSAPRVFEHTVFVFFGN